MSVGTENPRIRRSGLQSSLTPRRVGWADPSPPPSPPHPVGGGGAGSPARSPASSSTQWSRTSFKLSKPRPSKTRYLTRSEVLGISLSIVLSFLVAASVAFIIYLATPLAYHHINLFVSDVTEIAQAMRDGPSSPRNSAGKQSTKIFSLRSMDKSLLPSTPALISLSDGAALEKRLEEMSFASGWRDISIWSMGKCFDRKDSSPAARISLHLLASNHSFDLPSLNLEKGQHYCAIEDESMLVEEVIGEEMGIGGSFLDLKYLRPAVRLSVEIMQPELKGSNFHAEPASLTYLVEGKRHWVLFPPLHGPHHGYSPQWPLQLWLRRRDERDGHMISITQHARQWIYVPDGWLWATMTEGEEASIALSLLARQPSRQTFLYFLMEGDIKMKQGDYTAAIRIYKLGLGVSRHIDLLLRLAEAHIGLQAFTAAEELLRDAIRLNPRHCLAYGKLIEILVLHGNRDVSDAIADLLHQAESHGVKEEVLRLADEALR
eukprot:gene6973-7715_t